MGRLDKLKREAMQEANKRNLGEEISTSPAVDVEEESHKSETGYIKDAPVCDPNWAGYLKEKCEEAKRIESLEKVKIKL